MKSLRFKFFVYSTLFCVVGLAVTSGYSYFMARKALLNRTFMQLTSLREVKSQQIEDFLTERTTDAKIIAYHLGNQTKVGNDISESKTFEASVVEFINLGILNRSHYSSVGLYYKDKGFYLWQMGPQGQMPSVTYTNLEGLSAHFLAIDSLLRPYFIEIGIFKNTPKLSLLAIAPIAVNSGEKVFVILEVSGKVIDTLMQEHNNESGLGHSGEIYLVGGDMKMRSTSRFLTRETSEMVCKTQPVELALADKMGTLRTLDYRGVDVLSSFKPIQFMGIKWVIAAEIDWSEALGDTLVLRKNIFIIGLSIFIVIAISALYFSWRITRHLTNLKNAAKRIADGKFDYVLPIENHDEIGSLVQAFNKMTLRLKHATHKLKEREMRLLHFYRATNDGIILHKTGTALMVNRAALTLTGYCEEELLKMNPNAHFADDEHLLLKSEKNEIHFFETELITKNKSRIPVEVQRKRMVYNEQDVEALVIRNISERRAIEKELKEERLHRLKSVIDGQEQERQRLSRELHDGLGQTLVAIKLRLESIHPDRLGEEKRTFEMVKTMFNQTIEETRRISNNLMPAALTEFSLAVVLRNLCNEVETNSGITISLVVGVLPDSLNLVLKTYAYRITQEALTNIVKHSGASKAVVSVFSDILKLYLHIEDNGTGFHTNIPQISGNGLYNMKERASLLGGKLVIVTSPGNGVKIKAELPFNEHNLR